MIWLYFCKPSTEEYTPLSNESRRESIIIIVVMEQNSDSHIEKTSSDCVFWLKALVQGNQL